MYKKGDIRLVRAACSNGKHRGSSMQSKKVFKRYFEGRAIQSLQGLRPFKEMAASGRTVVQGKMISWFS